MDDSLQKNWELIGEAAAGAVLPDVLISQELLSRDEERKLGEISLRGFAAARELTEHALDTTGASTPSDLNSMVVDGRLARAALVAKNIPFLVRFSGFYTRPPSVSRLDVLDTGLLGMMQAAERFDPKKTNGGRFITYAKHWIRLEIGRLLAPARQLADARSLDATIGPGEEQTFYDLLPDKTFNPEPNDPVPDDPLAPVRARFARLSEVESEALMAHFGITGPALDHKEIAAKIKRNPSQVPIILQRSVAKLRVSDEAWEAGDTPQITDDIRQLFHGTARAPRKAPPAALDDMLWDRLTPDQQEVLKLVYGIRGAAKTTLQVAGEAIEGDRFVAMRARSSALAVLNMTPEEFELHRGQRRLTTRELQQRATDALQWYEEGVHINAISERLGVKRRAAYAIIKSARASASPLCD